MKNLGKKATTRALWAQAMLAAAAVSGCGVLPRARMGSLAAPTIGTPFLDPGNMGAHSYGYLRAPFEKNGIVYTCRGGSIDITHLRWNADYTRFLVNRTRGTLMKTGNRFSFNLAFEPSTHCVRFHYPDNWDSLSKDQKEEIADAVAFAVGPYLAYNATMWHEILTWFGTHFIAVEPEFNSAFSWEDTFSNLLGTHLAIRAMKDKEHSYDRALTLALNEELAALGDQPRHAAVDAVEKMRGHWFSGNFAVHTYRRNFDMGLDDGCVTAVLIPDAADCQGQPASYPAWTLDLLTQYGVSLTYEIKPNVMEQGKIFRAAGGSRIYPEAHFPILLDYIRSQAAELGHLFDQRQAYFGSE